MSRSIATYTVLNTAICTRRVKAAAAQLACGAREREKPVPSRLNDSAAALASQICAFDGVTFREFLETRGT